MSKSKKQAAYVGTLWEERSAESVSEEKEPEVLVEEALLISIEQVALSKKFTPVFKQSHLPSILAFCRSTGLPELGSEEEMLQVLAKFGYKV